MVYPNPAVDFVNFSWAEKAGSQATLLIFNATGKVVFTKNFEKIPNGAFRIDLSDLLAGSYHMTVHLKGSQAQSRQFLIVK